MRILLAITVMMAVFSSIAFSQDGNQTANATRNLTNISGNMSDISSNLSRMGSELNNMSDRLSDMTGKINSTAAGLGD